MEFLILSSFNFLDLVSVCFIGSATLIRVKSLSLITKEQSSFNFTTPNPITTKLSHLRNRN